jgi:hypothetical protein
VAGYRVHNHARALRLPSRSGAGYLMLPTRAVTRYARAKVPRVLLITDSQCDADQSAALAMLRGLNDVRLTEHALVDDRAATTLRAALRARRSAGQFDLLLTVGRVARRAGLLWPGPGLHLVGIAERVARGVRPQHASLIGCDRTMAGEVPAVASPRRGAGVFVPGTPSHASGHQFAWHATGILYYRDEQTRLLTTPGPSLDRLQRTAIRTLQPRLIDSRPVSAIDELIARAAIALVAPQAACERWPILRAMAAGLPVIALRSRHTAWLPDALVTKLDSHKPRVVARLLLARAESPTPPPPQAATWAATRLNATSARAAWKALIDRVLMLHPRAVSQ